MASIAVGGPITIMPVGDSGTIGADFYTGISGGYRDSLAKDLAAANISFTFVGACNLNSTPALTASGNDHHNGYGFYRVDGILNNLNGNGQPTPGDSNQGGYWLTGGNGTGREPVSPDIVLLEIGANDLIQHYDPLPNPKPNQFIPDLEKRLNTLVTTFHTLSPHTIIMVAGIYPFNNSPEFNTQIKAYNDYIKKTLVPSLPYTRFVDQYSSFLKPDGTVDGALLGTDNVHPTRYGYPVLARNWAAAIIAQQGSKPTLYSLTVNNGTGSGSYPAGTIVTVSSTVPKGKQFAGWSEPTTALSNPYWPAATFVMPAAATTLTSNSGPTGVPVIPDGIYNISSFFNGLSVSSADTASGSLIQQQPFTGAATQKWKLTNLGNNVVELSLDGTDQALEIADSSTAVGGKLDIASYTGAKNQQWTLTHTLGTTQIVNVNSGLVVNISGYQMEPGGQLVQNTAGYIANQIWAFFPVPKAN